LIMWDLACSSLHVMQQILRGKLDKSTLWVSILILIYCYHDYNLESQCGDGVSIWEHVPPPTSCYGI
jgi:hypothetical protein